MDVDPSDLDVEPSNFTASGDGPNAGATVKAAKGGEPVTEETFTVKPYVSLPKAFRASTQSAAGPGDEGVQVTAPVWGWTRRSAGPPQAEKVNGRSPAAWTAPTEL